MGKIARTLKGIIFAAFLLPHICFAYSGAGAECGNSALENAARKGTPEGLTVAIDQGVLLLEKVVAGWSKEWAWHPNNQNTSRVWLDKNVKRASRDEKRRIFAQWWTGCREIKLLDAAVSTANKENVEFLLSLGADPNSPSYRGRTLLMRCPYEQDGRVIPDGVPPARTQEQQERVLAIYSLLLKHGASTSQQDSDGLNALHLCNDPAIIKLFINAGSDVSIGVDLGRDPSTIHDHPTTRRVVDYRARKIAKGLIWEADAQFEIIEQILPLINDRRVTAETERLISWGCEDSVRTSICSRLAGLISARDSKIFKPLKERNSQVSEP